MNTWEYHVELQEDARWAVRRGDQAKPGAFYAHRNAAVSAARVLAHQNGGVVVVHEAGGGLTKTNYRGHQLTE